VVVIMFHTSSIHMTLSVKTILKKIDILNLQIGVTNPKDPTLQQCLVRESIIGFTVKHCNKLS